MEFITTHRSLLFKISFFLFCGISIFASSTLHAATRVSLQHLTASELQQWFPLPFLQAGPNTRIVPTAQLSLIERHTDARHIEHVRMQQRYQGIPVFGGYAIFHQSTNESAAPAAVRMNGALYQSLQGDLGLQPAWFLSSAHRALNQYSQQFPQAQIVAETHSEHLIRRIQRLVGLGRSKGGLDPADVSIICVEQDRNGVSFHTQIPLNRQGNFMVRWPGGFFDFEDGDEPDSDGADDSDDDALAEES